MTTSHPSAVWDGESSTRPDGNVNRAPDGSDWQRIVSEMISVSDQLDALGVPFATSDPDKGKRLYANTLVLTLGGNSAAEDYPNRWDKTTPTRPDGDDRRAPDGADWLELISRINILEARIQPLGLPLPTAEGSNGDTLWADGTNEIQSLASIVSTSGNWTLTVLGQTTGNLAFDADGATVQVAVDLALAGLDINGILYTAGDLAITGGAINAGAQTLTYGGASVANTNVAQATTADVDLNDGTPPVASTSTPGVNGVVTVSDEAGSHVNDLWDGTSPSRVNADVFRGPDCEDYEEARLKLRLVADLLVTLDTAQDGGLPTSDPSIRGAWYTNAGVVTVSTGG